MPIEISTNAPSIDDDGIRVGTISVGWELREIKTGGGGGLSRVGTKQWGHQI